MGITGLISTYETFYGGVPNRIHNVEVVAHLVDDKLIAPGGISLLSTRCETSSTLWIRFGTPPNTVV